MKGFYLLTISIFIIIISILINYFFINNNIYSESFINNNLSVILIGDSILNNSNYIKNGEKTTFQHFNDIIINKYNKKINLYNYAEDGATINDCFRQLDKIDNINTNINNLRLNIILSCGGNDILHYNITNNNILQLNLLESKLMALIKTILTKFPLANIFILNLYYPFNSKFSSYNKIIEEWNSKINNFCVNSNKCKIIDISSKITSTSDLIYDIEPSSSGGKKIANIIANSI